MSHLTFQIQSTKRDIAQRQSTLQQLQSEFDDISLQHLNNHPKLFLLCESLEQSCRKQIIESSKEVFGTLYSIMNVVASKNTTPPPLDKKDKKKKKSSKIKKLKNSLWGKKKNNDSNSKNSKDTSKQVSEQGFSSSSESDDSTSEEDSDDDNEQRKLQRRESIRLREMLGEALVGPTVATSALSPDEFISPKTARAIAEARDRQAQETLLQEEETISARTGSSPLLSPNGKNRNDDDDDQNVRTPTRRGIASLFSSKDESTNLNKSGGIFSTSTSNAASPSARNNNNNNPQTPFFSAFASLFGVGNNNNNSENQQNSTTATAASKNINLSYDEEILKSSVLQKQYQEQNPNQLGDLLLDPYHPMWYTGKCLSAVIRTYYSGQVLPEKVEIKNSHEEQNVAAMATSVMNTAVTTAETVVGTATSLFGTLISKTSDFVKQIGGKESNNNSSQNSSSKGGIFSWGDKRGNNNSSNNNDNEQRPIYIVEPVWLHMENNDIVVNTVQPSLFLPFPSFNEHNDDDKLRSLYREMARRSAAERSRREGTTAAVPVHSHRAETDVTATGGFAANDARSIYNKNVFSQKKESSSSNQNQNQQNHNDPNNNKNNNFSSLIRSQPRHIRADEFRVAFFATDMFKRVHKALDFDTNDLVEHSIFDLAHPWRVAHSPGKSDSSFFFFGHFVAKSLKEHEFKFFFEKFLPKYVAHVEINKFTLLPHFLGLLSIADLSRGSASPQILRIVIMNNVFPTRRVIHRMYDLKGSTINRDGLSGDITKTSFGAVLLKDNDLPKKLLLIGPVRSRLLTLQLRCDTDFLNSLSVIDYSLLVGVRSEYLPVGPNGVDFSASGKNSSSSDEKNSHRHNEEDGSCFKSWDGGMPSLPIFDNPNDMTSARIDTFYIGLIDVLQNFSAAKRFEATTKGFLYSGQASVVPPDEFATRICESIERITE